MEADLLAAVYAAPEDDAPRFVYADYLQERGDPRGQFIALQLAGKDVERQAALIAEHGPSWIGDLPIAPHSVRWERGFIGEGAPRPGADPSDPRWRTLHALTGAALLSDTAPLPALRKLVVDNHGMHHLGTLRRPLPVETLAWDSRVDHGMAGVRLSDVTVLRRLRRFESLDDHDVPLRTQTEDARRLFSWRCMAAIEEVALYGDLASAHDWLDLAGLRSGPLRRLELAEPGPFGWRLALARAGAGPWSALEIIAPFEPPQAWLRASHRPFGEALFAGLAAFAPTQFTTARVTAPPSLLAPIERALARQIRLVELVRVPR